MNCTPGHLVYHLQPAWWAVDLFAQICGSTYCISVKFPVYSFTTLDYVQSWCETFYKVAQSLVGKQKSPGLLCLYSKWVPYLSEKNKVWLWTESYLLNTKNTNVRALSLSQGIFWFRISAACSMLGLPHNCLGSLKETEKSMFTAAPQTRSGRAASDVLPLMGDDVYSTRHMEYIFLKPPIYSHAVWILSLRMQLPSCFLLSVSRLSFMAGF